MMKIIDASVAIKWFLETEEKTKDALEILDDIQNNPKNYAVPELFFNEMLHVFCKILNDDAQIQNYLSLLQDLGFYRLGNDKKLLNKAVFYAKKYGLSGYDAVYVANADLIKGIWITADQKAHKKVISRKLSRLL